MGDLYRIQRQMDDYERGAEMMERQMDKLIYENGNLRREVEELKLEIARLKSGTGGHPDPA